MVNLFALTCSRFVKMISGLNPSNSLTTLRYEPLNCYLFYIFEFIKVIKFGYKLSFCAACAYD